MRYLVGAEAGEAENYLQMAAQVALRSKCSKSQRGSVIIKEKEVLGKGCNCPPLEEKCESCLREEIKDNSRTELCYSVHAEQNAIVEALKTGRNLKLSRLYHTKVKDDRIVPVGPPSCTQCSKLILQAGISEVVLLHREGIALYTSKEFSEKSFEYFR